MAVCALVLVGRAAYFQVIHDQEFLARDVRIFEADGVKRAQHNPRLTSLAREIRRGNIYDRNGVLLATSDWNELERYRAEYEKLGIAIDDVCSRLDSRHYPFGELTAHFLGDWRTGENFHATNASLVEHDSNVKLQGYRDYQRTRAAGSLPPSAWQRGDRADSQPGSQGAHVDRYPFAASRDRDSGAPVARGETG